MKGLHGGPQQKLLVFGWGLGCDRRRELVWQAAEAEKFWQDGNFSRFCKAVRSMNPTGVRRAVRVFEAGLLSADGGLPRTPEAMARRLTEHFRQLFDIKARSSQLCCAIQTRRRRAQRSCDARGGWAPAMPCRLPRRRCGRPRTPRLRRPLAARGCCPNPHARRPPQLVFARTAKWP